MGERIKKKNKWLALIAVMLTYSFAFLTRYIYSPLMLDISEEFLVNATKAGLYMTGFMVGYLCMQIPGGIMADNLKPKYILIVDLVVSGICTALMSIINVYWAGLVLRIIIGVSCGSIYSCCSKIISYYFESKDIAVAMGCLLASGPFGIVIANSLGEPFSALYGWRMTFVGVSAISLIAIILLYLFVEPFAGSKDNSEKGNLFEGIKVYLSDTQQLILGASGFMLMFVTVGFATWTNSYLQTIGITGIQGGQIITFYSISGIIFSCFSGWIAKKLNIKSKKFLVLTLTMMIPFTIMFLMAKSYWTLMIVGLFYGAFTYLPSTHYVSLAMARADERSIAVTAALQNLIFQFGGLVQSALIGIIIDKTGTYSSLWYAFLVACVLQVVFALIFKEDR